MKEDEELKVALIRELADDLEAWIENYYKLTKDYPSELRRYNRDMDVVHRARKII